MELQHLKSNDSSVRLALRGMLDLTGVTQIESSFLAATVAVGKSSVVDLSQVPFIASLGLGLLISATKGLKRKGARLILLAPTAEVAKVFAAAGLLDVMTIAYDEAEVSRILSTTENCLPACV